MLFPLPLLLLAAFPAPSPGAANALIDRIVAGEQDFLQRLRPLQPILEVYLQEVAGGGDLAADHYLIGKLDLRDGPEHLTFQSSPAFQKPGRRFGRRRGSSLTLSAAGFAQMVVLDADDFNRETYSFDYVRREFLGDLRCLIFDVAPRDRKAAGKFVGRIWVEDKDYRIVRFNGTYSHSRPAMVFFHFDSWRVHVGPGWYVPALIYIEDSRPRPPKEQPRRLKGQVRLWGYNAARAGRWEELTSILIEADTPVRDQAATPGDSASSAPSIIASLKVRRESSDTNPRTC